MTAASHQVVSTWDPFRGGISEKKLWPYMAAMGNRQIKAAELFLFDGRLGAADQIFWVDLMAQRFHCICQEHPTS